MSALYEFIGKPILKGELWQIPYRLGRKVNDLSSGKWDDFWRLPPPCPEMTVDASRLYTNGIVLPQNKYSHDETMELFWQIYGVMPNWRRTVEWTNVAGKEPQACFWHRDNEGPMTMKVFTYLNDVSEDQGPHQYVRGSHLDKPKSYNGEQNPIRKVTTVTGLKGTTFIEIPHGVHRSTMVTKGERVVSQTFYSYTWRPDTERI